MVDKYENLIKPGLVGGPELVGEVGLVGGPELVGEFGLEGKDCETSE